MPVTAVVAERAVGSATRWSEREWFAIVIGVYRDSNWEMTWIAHNLRVTRDRVNDRAGRVMNIST